MAREGARMVFNRRLQLCILMAMCLGTSLKHRVERDLMAARYQGYSAEIPGNDNAITVGPTEFCG